jgi:dipeptide/tripeptide permease
MENKVDNSNKIEMKFGHPKGLWFMFGTEMWERFGYYLMLGIFSLYMIDGWNNGGMGFSDGTKSDIYGTYLGLVYLTPFIGGLLADRLLGYRRSIILGGLMMAAGYFLLSMHSTTSFYIALLLIILGNGFFKPNISTLVGSLYSEESLKDKKDAGFNIFYMGINIGAFICNFVAAYMRINYGWGAAFAAAGVGMLVGVIIFILGNRHIKSYDVVKPLQDGDMSTGKILGLTVLPMFLFGTIGYMLPGNFLGSDTNDAFIIGCLPVIGFFIYLAFKSEAKESRAIKALLAVFTCVILFFAIFHQNGDALTIWAEDHTDREMSAGVAGVADKVGMAQKVENSPIVSGNDSVYSETVIFLTAFESTLPKETKEEFAIKKNYAEKLELLDKSRKYFSTMPSSKIPTVSALQLNGNIDSTLKAESKTYGIIGNNVNSVKVILSTPTKQLPLALLNKSNYSQFIKAANFQIDSLKGQVDSLNKVNTKDKKELKIISETIKANNLSIVNWSNNIGIATLLSKYIKKSDDKIEVANLKLYSTELYQSINPFWVVLLTPVMVGIWGFFRRRKGEPSTPTKIFIGLIITALSALVMVGAVFATNNMDMKASSMWLIASYGVITIGELCLSPMGLSLVSKLSPPRITALMMGGFFLAISVGNKLSGMLSSLWETTPQKENFFYLNFGLVMAAALILLAMLRWLNRVMKENNVL